MSSKRIVTLQLQNATPKKPTLWRTEGSLWRRTPETAKLLLESAEEADRDALPADREREIPILFRQVRILTPGNWNGYDFWTEGFIKASARNFRVERPRPLQVDHSYSGNDNHGKVFDLLALPPMEGKPAALVGLIGILGAYAIERVEDGRWDTFSGNWWLGETEEDTEFIELSFTPFPGCDDTAFLTHVLTKLKSDKEGSMPKEDEKKVLTGAGAQGSEPPKEEKTAELKAGDDQPTTAELLALIKQQNDEMAELRRDQAETARLRTEERIGNELIKLTREGYAAPAAFDDEKAFLMELTDEQRATYYELARKRPKVANPGRQSDPNATLSKSQRDDAEADADFDDIKALIRK